MADDTLPGAADDKTTLHDDITKAFADAAATPEPAAADAPAADSGPPRDASGRFAPKDPSAAEPSSPAVTPEAAAVPSPAATPPASIEPLQHWPAELKAEFAKVPTEHRGLLQGVIKRMESAHQARVSEVGEYAKVGEVLTPHMEQLKQAGYSPSTYVAMLKDTHLNLLRDPKAGFKTLLSQYGITPQDLMDGAAPAAADVPATDANGNPIDPAVKAMLDATLKPIKDELEQRKRREAQEAEARTTAEITAFADAKDPQGQPLRPYFAEVYADLVALASVERANGRAPSLQTLYDKAVWANPSTREKLLAAKSAADAAKAEQEQKAKTEAARKASASVVSNGAAVPAQPSAQGNDRRGLIAAEFAKYDAA